MSCHDREEGSIVVPEEEWEAVRKTVTDAADVERAERIRFAQSFHEILTTGQGDMDIGSWMVRARAVVREWPGGIPERQRAVIWHVLGHPPEKIRPLDERGRPLRPECGSWPEPVTDPSSIEVTGGRIAFDEDARTIRWEVDQNNHAVRSARADPVALALFRSLRGVRWTENSGGTVRYRDEYGTDRTTPIPRRPKEDAHG